MSTLQNNTLNAMNFQMMLETTVKEKQSKEDSQALLLSLSQTLEAVLDSANPKAQNSPVPQTPSAATMQQEMGRLMGILSELEGKIAQCGNDKTKLNTEVSNALVLVTQAQIGVANAQMQKVIDAESASSFWSIFTKVIEGVVGGIVTIVAAFTCPPLAALTLAMTVLTVSGGMDDAVKACSAEVMNLIPGVTKEQADLIASSIAIAVTIAATVITAGACASSSASAVAEEAAEAGGEAVEEGVEMADLSVNAANEAAGDAAGEAVDEASETFAQRASNFLGKIASKLKTAKNPLANLSKTTKLGIAAGAMAVGNTGFGQDLAVVVLSKMKDGKLKNDLEIAINMIVSLMAAFAGAGAGASLVASGARACAQGNVLTGLLAGLLVGGVTQAGGQVGEGLAQCNLASATESLGEAQAAVTATQAVANMNSAQMAADTKALKGMLQARAQGMVSLGADVVKAEVELTRVLQA